MALELQKTLIGKKYTLFIEVLYVGQQRTMKETNEVVEKVRMEVFQSREHRAAGFPALLRKRWEDIRGSDVLPTPFKYTNQEEYTNVLLYIHQYVIDNLDWYQGAVIIEPIDVGDPISGQSEEGLESSEPVEVIGDDNS